jgi:hypothetical protein
VGEFVGEQGPAGAGGRGVLPGREDDVPADREGQRSDRLCRAGGRLVVVHPHVREVVLEQWLQLTAGAHRQRVTAPPESGHVILDLRPGGVRRWCGRMAPQLYRAGPRLGRTDRHLRAGGAGLPVLPATVLTGTRADHVVRISAGLVLAALAGLLVDVLAEVHVGRRADLGRRVGLRARSGLIRRVQRPLQLIAQQGSGPRPGITGGRRPQHRGRHPLGLLLVAVTGRSDPQPGLQRRRVLVLFVAAARFPAPAPLQ